MTPLFFAGPALPAAAPVVFFLWYGGGAIGGLIGSRRKRVASWVSLALFVPLFANSSFRIYLAATAQPHVTIGGGVIGNAAMAALFAVLAVAAWWMLRRAADAESIAILSRQDDIDA